MSVKGFHEILKKIKNDRLFSSEAVELFASCNGQILTLELSFIQFSTVLGQQLDSQYDNGFKYDCIIEDEQQVIVLFPESSKDFVQKLSDEESLELKVQVLGYDSLYQKPILGCLTGVSDLSEPEPELELELDQVASVSAAWDSEIENIIADAIDKVGKDGAITVQEGKNTDTTLDVVVGMQFDKGYLSPYFVTDPNTQECNFDDALILIFEKKINNLKYINPLLEKVSKAGNPLLIIAEDVEASVLDSLVDISKRGTFKLAAVRSLGLGDRRKAMLEDIAVLTGGRFITEGLAIEIESLDVKDLGKASRVSIGKEETTIIEGEGKQKDITERLNQIRFQIEETTSDEDREKLLQRLAKLAGGVAVINVGATTETEMKLKKARVEDALQATRAAVQEGVLSNVKVESPINSNKIAKVGVYLVLVPIIVFFANLDYSDDGQASKSISNNNNGLDVEKINSRRLIFDETIQYYNIGLTAFRENDLARAENSIRYSLYILSMNKTYVDGSKFPHPFFSSYELLGQIYEEVNDHYQSFKCYSLAEEYSKYMDRQDAVLGNSSFRKGIDRQFEKLREQGLESRIDEENRRLLPMDGEWQGSMLRVAAKDYSLMEEKGDQVKKYYQLETGELYTGWARSFHENNTRKELAHYRKGLRHGLSFIYKKNGKSELRGSYKDGVKNGVQVKFGNAGKVEKQELYHNGKLLKPHDRHGSQRVLWLLVICIINQFFVLMFNL